MTLDQWLLLIDRYGLPLIALVIIIVWLAPKLNQLWETVFKVPPNNIKVENLFRTDQEINQVLAEIVNKMHVGWATVWQFHNGSITMMGIPFLRVSATHSQTMRGYARHAELFQGMSTSLLGDLSPLLTELIVRVTPESPSHAAIGSSMKAMGIRTMYGVPLFNACNVLIGVLTISFREDIIISEDDEHLLYDYKARIVILLDRMASEKNKKEKNC